MSEKAIIPREQAKRDVEAAIDYYRLEAGSDVAIGFIDALEAAYHAITERPAAGSPRYAHELALPGLRSRGVKRHPIWCSTLIAATTSTSGACFTSCAIFRRGCESRQDDARRIPDLRMFRRLMMKQ